MSCTETEKLCAEIRSAIRVNPDVLGQYLTCQAIRLAKICVENDLACLDVPILVSHMLKVDLLDDNTIRKIWRRVKKVVQQLSRIKIFDDGRLRLSLILELKRGAVYIHRDLGVPLDEADLERAPYVQISNAYKLYAYLEAKFEEDVFLRVNIVYLLKKLLELGLRDLVDNLGVVTLLLLRLKLGQPVDRDALLAKVKQVLLSLRAFEAILKDFVKPALIKSPTYMTYMIPPLRQVVSDIVSSLLIE